MNEFNRQHSAHSVLDGLGPMAALVAVRQSMFIGRAEAWRSSGETRSVRRTRRRLRRKWRRPDWTLPPVLPPVATLFEEPS